MSSTGTVYGGLANPKLTFSDKIKLRAGINKLALLSVAVGLPVSSHTLLEWLCCLIYHFSIAGEFDPSSLFYEYQNVGTHFETWNTGVLGPVTLKGLNSGTWDMSKWKWSYKVC